MILFRSLQSRVMLGAAILLFLLLGLAQYRASEKRRDDIGIALSRLQLQTDAIAARFDDVLHNTYTFFIALLTDLDMQAFSRSPTCRNALGEILARDKVLDNIALTLQDGLTVCNGRNAPVLDLSDYPFFQQALLGNVTVAGNPQISPGTGNMVIPFAHVIRDSRGNALGAVGASINLANLLDEFSRSESLQAARMGIVSNDGIEAKSSASAKKRPAWRK